MTRFATLMNRLADLTANPTSPLWALVDVKTKPDATLIELTAKRPAAADRVELRDAA